MAKGRGGSSEEMNAGKPAKGKDNQGRSETGIQGGGASYASGRDAAYIEPRLIPDYQLQGRDDSGGPEYQPYTASFGDGGFVNGAKRHLSAHGGKDDPMDGDELSDEVRAGRARKAMGYSGNVNGPDGGSPTGSKRMQEK